MKRPSCLTENLAPLFKVKITLIDTPYPCWRRLLLQSDISLFTFVRYMVRGMGWLFTHGFMIQIGDTLYESKDRMEPGRMFITTEMEDADKYLVKDILSPDPEKILDLRYDLGDCWDHDVVIEEAVANEGSVRVPLCLEGEGACPPEDCGGEGGFQRFLELMENPENNPKEYASWIESLKTPFNKDKFEVSESTSRMRKPCPPPAFPDPMLFNKMYKGQKLGKINILHNGKLITM